MKILVFTDPHGNLNLLEKHKLASKKVDAVIITGDLSYAGQELEKILKKISEFHSPVYLIHGNHEDEEELEALCESYENITFVHKKIIPLEKYRLGAFSTSGMRMRYPDFEKWVSENKEELRNCKQLLWMDHPPPYDTRLDELDANWHVGSESLRKFIEEFSPMYVFCGHIHETFEQEDSIKDTIIINSGPAGRIIELP